jgi:hypothetical protein
MVFETAGQKAHPADVGVAVGSAETGGRQGPDSVAVQVFRSNTNLAQRRLDG